MSVRVLGLPFAIAALLIAGCGTDEGAGDLTSPGEGVTRQIAGVWTGTLHQQGMAPFEIAVDVGADSTAQVAYTAIRCGGDWTLDRVQPSTPPRYLFTEEIKQGAGGSCKGTGTVSLSPIQGHSPNEPAYKRMNYSFSGGGVTSRGLLHRAAPASLNAVFREAGVSPP